MADGTPPHLRVRKRLTAVPGLVLAVGVDSSGTYLVIAFPGRSGPFGVCAPVTERALTCARDGTSSPWTVVHHSATGTVGLFRTLVYGSIRVGGALRRSAARVGVAVSRLSTSDQNVGDGRRYWRADLCASGTRKGSSGGPWRGLDPTPKGMHWAFGTDRLDELDAENRIYWPKRGTGWPQYKRYRDELKGRAVGDIWTDIDRINPVAAERLGYPTQKPLALLERIIAASSNEGDVVLDPFCGCGTALDAAQKLGRRWVGIDVTYLAVDLIQKRMRHTYGDDIASTYTVRGIPTDLAGAQALFTDNPFDFERWAVSLVDGQPNEKQVGDKGVDGRIRFHADSTHLGTAVVSVKGGGQVNPAMVQSLLGAVKQHKADMGIFVMLAPSTKGMREVAAASGSYNHAMTGKVYPKLQILTVADLLAHKRPNMPSPISPYFKAKARPGEQLALI